MTDEYWDLYTQLHTLAEWASKQRFAESVEEERVVGERVAEWAASIAENGWCADVEVLAGDCVKGMQDSSGPDWCSPALRARVARGRVYDRYAEVGLAAYAAQAEGDVARGILCQSHPILRDIWCAGDFGSDIGDRLGDHMKEYATVAGIKLPLTWPYY